MVDIDLLTKYTYKEVHEATLAYFSDDTLATEVWINKYCLKDSFGNFFEKTPDDMHRRIAKELARIESNYPNPISEEEIYETIKKFNRIVPQGSPMAGIGNNFQVVSLSNCFVIGNDKDSDSYGGIMKLDQEMVQLQKRRGGVGLDMSFIRPAGTPVKNSAITSTGVVPFMERYSNSTREVAQDGRRGALMESIGIRHPDAEAFIDAKMEQGKVTGANISVRIDDEFMKAVIDDTEYLQCYPLDLFKIMSEQEDATMYLFSIMDLKNYGELNKLYPVEDKYGKKLGYIKKIDAKKLWKKIIHNAWKSAEPGILFWDKVMTESIPDCYSDQGFRTVSTNPCVSEDTLVLTDNGYIPIGKLVDKKVNVWNGEEFSEVTPSITGHNQKMLKITFSDGTELKCTEYHGFYTWDGFERDGNVIKKEAKNLVIGDKLEKYKFPLLLRHKVLDIDKSYYTLGFFAGDGFIKRDSTTHISLYGEKKNLINKLNINGNISENIENDRLTIRVELPYIDIDLHELKKYVPKYHDNYSTSMMSWLSGIIDSDGSRNTEEGSISISSIDREFLMNIKLHVLNTFGVNGSVIDEKEGGLKEIKGHEYETNDSYRLIISAYNVKKLYDLGLRTFRVKIDDVNPNRDASRFIKVISIEKIDDAENVYCFTEEKRGRGCFNGLVTANCGEIPLCPYDSCRLLCINLYGYVIDPFDKEDAYFDWNLFKNDVQKAMRYMDDIVDLEVEKIDAILEKIKSDPEEEFIKLYEINLWERIKEMTLKGRRTGLGVTGEGDMLAALNLIYGTEEATKFSEEIHKTLKLNAYRSSVTMAKERGEFPIYEWVKEMDNPFIKRIREEDPLLGGEMKEFGRRNIALLTVAPTGTASLMTQTTSGIECCFLPVYIRRRKINPQEKNVRVDFIDNEGISWTEYPVFHHKFETWLEVNGYKMEEVKLMNSTQVDEIVKQSPYYKATSNDVDWVKKVEMQGKIQRHIDHSISVTINVPEETTEEIITSIYETAWQSGCKGITVYRDGSRSGVLITNKDKKEAEFHDSHAPKRPKRLKGEIHRFQNNLEKWIAVVGIKDGRPYEIFTGKNANGLTNLPSTIKECEVVKNIIETEELDPVNGGLMKVKRKRYDIEYVDTDGNKQVHTGLNHAFNPEFWNYAKLISGIMRHGMPVIKLYELIDSLTFPEEHITTWKNGVVRVIKKYIKDGEKGKGKCQSCGSEHLEFQEGCMICKNCGSSKCS